MAGGSGKGPSNSKLVIHLKRAKQEGGPGPAGEQGAGPEQWFGRARRESPVRAKPGQTPLELRDGHGRVRGKQTETHRKARAKQGS